MRTVAALMLTAGCAGGPVEVGSADSSMEVDGPTWHADVAPVLTEHCVGCHVADGIGWQVPLDTYEGAYAVHGQIGDQVGRALMPPFHAESTDECAPRFPWIRDPRLEDTEVELLGAWVKAGAPEGDPASAAPISPPVPLHLDDWDVELGPEQPYRATRGDVQICFALPPGISSTQWLTAIEVLPEATQAVHHVQVRIDPAGAAADRGGDKGWYECTGALEGTDVGGWLPGAPPIELPGALGIEVDPSDAIMMQVHYHVIDDSEHLDATRLRIRFSEDRPTFVPRMMRIGNDTGPEVWGGLQPGVGGEVEFAVPPGAVGHTETMRYDVRVPGEYAVFMVANHMHYAGVDAMLWVEHATPSAEEPGSECLLHTPRWDFDWQQMYQYDFTSGRTPYLREGDSVFLRCTYDNTWDNAAWADALAGVGVTDLPTIDLGASATQEMCAAMLGVVRLDGG